jgi:hypothetical protein
MQMQQELKPEPLQTEEYERRRKVWETIKTLVKSEQEELYRILKRGNFEVTENTNGVFFDLSKLPQSLFEQIIKFIEFCSQNRLRFEERDKEMDSLRTL